ncbi:MAG: hypoxanthine phosphoribosyltransferase [Acidobacteria bacterium]|nr:MAG: hypoxanthine phosphoribosyltransferase [Acidobacteriota bacterium]
MNERLIEIFSAAQIAERIDALAHEIGAAYDERELTVLGVLEDGFVFLADLLRQLKLPLRIAFLRYDHRSLGGVQDLQFSAQTDLTGRDVMLVEAVLETGVPQEYIMRQLAARGARSIKLCVLLDKPDRRRVELKPDWRAFETHEEYVVGYGLGLNERWRNLPYLARASG